MTDRLEEPVWEYMRAQLDFNDSEMANFRNTPRNAEIIAKGLAAMDTKIVFEVVQSKGCFSGHRTGDRLTFDLQGNLLTGKCPERVCMHAVQAGAHHLFAAGELLHHGVDPEQMRFKRFGCLDVGLECGGWGHVVMEIKVVRPE